jgi:NADPH-dependent ferric siderophore reductase
MTSAATRRPVPDDQFGGRMKDCFLLDLEVSALADVRPHMRTITFASPDLVDFTWKPGQDVMLEVPGASAMRRRYTIRRADAVKGTLDIEVVLHGTGPFASWASAAAIGDHIHGIGPRGVITLREDAAHHLFVADASAIPFAFAMIEALPHGTTATAIVATDDPHPLQEAPESAAEVDVTWISTDELSERLESIELPRDTAAYVNGERLLVRGATEQLTTRGLHPDSIAAKPYWRRDQANAAHGEPAKEAS